MEGMVAFQSVDGICPIDCVETDGADKSSINTPRQLHQIAPLFPPRHEGGLWRASFQSLEFGLLGCH